MPKEITCQKGHSDKFYLERSYWARVDNKGSILHEDGEILLRCMKCLALVLEMPYETGQFYKPLKRKGKK